MICGSSEECGCPAQKRIRDAPGKVAHLENGHCLSTIEFSSTALRKLWNLSHRMFDFSDRHLNSQL